MVIRSGRNLLSSRSSVTPHHVQHHHRVVSPGLVATTKAKSFGVSRERKHQRILPGPCSSGAGKGASQRVHWCKDTPQQGSNKPVDSQGHRVGSLADAIIGVFPIPEDPSLTCLQHPTTTKGSKQSLPTRSFCVERDACESTSALSLIEKAFSGSWISWLLVERGEKKEAVAFHQRVPVLLAPLWSIDHHPVIPKGERRIDTTVI